jgi:hypothetical protein
MAKDKKKKCKKCEENGETSCKCPKKGYYGLERYGDEDDHGYDDPGMDGGGDGGAMGESIKMPKAPSDADKSTRDMSSEKKKKSLDGFKAAADDAKKRKKYKDENDDLALTRMKKGVRFYDSKGSGYLKGGKKTYD